MKKGILFIGGSYHDFDGFSDFYTGLMREDGWSIEPVRDFGRMKELAAGGYGLAVLYTCFSVREGQVDEQAPVKIETGNIRALASWVGNGGALLAFHSATVIGTSDPELGRLIGGTFIEHPPQHTFAVLPLSVEHPVTAGVGHFCINDELYIQKYNSDAAVHMVTFDRGVAHPMVWTRSEGKGKVVYIAPGHDRAAWNNPAFIRLTRQAAGWLAL